jgi:hypothetical protein
MEDLVMNDWLMLGFLVGFVSYLGTLAFGG